MVHPRFLCKKLGNGPSFVTDPRMKKSTTVKTRPVVSRKKSSSASSGKIHPVIIYPFRQPNDLFDLNHLYQLVARLDADTGNYARPITVLDRKTHYANSRNKRFLEFRKKVVSRYSDVLDVWCVDTCQMWYAGLGEAFEKGLSSTLGS